MKRVSTLIKIAERHGWHVSPTDFGDGITGYELSKFSNFGQDFIFDIQAMRPGEKRESSAALIESAQSYVDEFDPIAEAYLWQGPDGHGRNGAPDDPRDIISDMEQCAEMIVELIDEWKS